MSEHTVAEAGTRVNRQASGFSGCHQACILQGAFSFHRMAPNAPTFSNLLRTAWEVYTSQFRFFLLLVGLLAFPLYLIADFTIPQPTPEELEAANRSLAELDLAGLSAASPAELAEVGREIVASSIEAVGVPEQYLVFALALNVAGMVLSLLITVTAIRGTRAALAGKIPLVGPEMALASRELGPLILTNIIVGLALVGSFLLFIVPGIILGVYWSLVAPAVVLSNRRYLHALRYSFQLVRGRWWETATVVAGSGLLVFAVVFALAVALAPLAAYPGLRALTDAITHVVSVFATVVVTTYFLRIEYQMAGYGSTTQTKPTAS
jgi:hypothetical protein